jgi:hypothetical protein
MQLAIGAAIVLIALVALQKFAVAGIADASAHCHELAAADWDRAQRECGAPYSPASPTPTPAPTSPEDRALTRVTTPPPSTSPASSAPPSSAPSTSSWVTSDTRAPYDRTDPTASPLDLPRCTTAPDTPVPCLAHASADGRHAVVLEEDGSMTGLTRR